MKQSSSQVIEKLKVDYEQVFSTPAGQRVLEDIKRSGSFFKTTFHHDPYIHANNAGRREFALHIVAMATPRPDKAKEVAIS